jgi:hypothetical protein
LFRALVSLRGSSYGWDLLIDRSIPKSAQKEAALSGGFAENAPTETYALRRRTKINAPIPINPSPITEGSGIMTNAVKFAILVSSAGLGGELSYCWYENTWDVPQKNTSGPALIKRDSPVGTRVPNRNLEPNGSPNATNTRQGAVTTEAKSGAAARALHDLADLLEGLYILRGSVMECARCCAALRVHCGLQLC